MYNTSYPKINPDQLLVPDHIKDPSHNLSQEEVDLNQGSRLKAVKENYKVLRQMNKHVKGGSGNWQSIGVTNRSFEAAGSRLHPISGTPGHYKNKRSVDTAVHP